MSWLQSNPIAALLLGIGAFVAMFIMSAWMRSVERGDDARPRRQREPEDLLLNHPEATEQRVPPVAPPPRKPIRALAPQPPIAAPIAAPIDTPVASASTQPAKKRKRRRKK